MHLKQEESHMHPTLAILLLTYGLAACPVLALQLSNPSTLDLSSPPTNDTGEGDDDPRFSIEILYGMTDIPVNPLLMNVVELMAQYAELDYLGKTRQRHGIVLPGYPQVEIAVIPAAPATTMDRRLVIWALYGAIIYMVSHNRFKEIEVPISWSGDVVGYIYFTISEDSALGGENGTANMQSANFATGVNNSTLMNHTSILDPVSVGQFDWSPVYKPDGENILPKDIFILAMGTLKAVAPHSTTDKIQWPFHIGSEIVNAHAEVYLHGRSRPRSQPPYFQYGHILEAARRIPGWMMQRRKFAELWVVLKSYSQPVGMLMYLKGPFRP